MEDRDKIETSWAGGWLSGGVTGMWTFHEFIDVSLPYITGPMPFRRRGCGGVERDVVTCDICEVMCRCIAAGVETIGTLHFFKTASPRIIRGVCSRGASGHNR